MSRYLPSGILLPTLILIFIEYKNISLFSMSYYKGKYYFVNQTIKTLLGIALALFSTLE